MALNFIRRLLCCFRGSQPVEEQVVSFEDFAALATIQVISKDGKKKRFDVPEAISKQYAKVIPEDVTIDGQGVCITSDIAVLGDVRITAGGTCITGNTLIFGDVIIDGEDGQTVNGTCITGSAIVLGNVFIRGNVCVTSNAFVKGDVKVEGHLDVGGKLCYWGQKEIRPLPPH